MKSIGGLGPGVIDGATQPSDQPSAYGVPALQPPRTWEMRAVGPVLPASATVHVPRKQKTSCRRWLAHDRLRCSTIMPIHCQKKHPSFILVRQCVPPITSYLVAPWALVPHNLGNRRIDLPLGSCPSLTSSKYSVPGQRKGGLHSYCSLVSSPQSKPNNGPNANMLVT